MGCHISPVNRLPLIMRGSIPFIALIAIGVMCYMAAAFDAFPGDEGAIRRFQGARSPWLDSAAIVASFMANTPVVVVSVPVLSIALWVDRRKADAAAVLLVLAADGLNALLKIMVDRPRPDFSLLESPPTNPAFPSGHAFHAFLFFGLLIFIVGDLIKPRWPRIATQVLLGLAALSVGASRIYLGVHWPSDVLGGFVVGGASLVVILWVRKKLLIGSHNNIFRGR